ncbi:hypothetical protein [Anthocerotibacter panamensis]|uniref:hypothetical protein n=1 Tax=Anthocerotibacter panamensis TaxID=2857077 RepID=UPI001C406DC0|nr:hypothetical protein [Anthocerotibacter panamensis]
MLPEAIQPKTCSTCPHFSALDDAPTRSTQGVRGYCSLQTKVARGHWTATAKCQ